jgi:hypothetical protein
MYETYRRPAIGEVRPRQVQHLWRRIERHQLAVRQSRRQLSRQPAGPASGIDDALVAVKGELLEHRAAPRKLRIRDAVIRLRIPIGTVCFPCWPCWRAILPISEDADVDSPEPRGEALMKANRRLFRLSTVIATSTVVLILATGGVGLSGQNKKAFSIANVDGTHVGLGLSIRKLGVAATFMNTPSHPDDEQNAFFTYFGYGLGMRVIDVQNNRGEGGQNEIGPEIMHGIGMLRTEELMAVHREDSAEQYFTRAIDYGYSYDPLGEIIPWIGEKEIVGDYVRLYRMLRPDVVVSMNISGQGGDRMHEAQTIMTREAVVAAGDPTKYPEQIAEGLRPWKPTKFYYNGTTIGGGRGYPEPPAAGPASAHLFDAKWFAHEGQRRRDSSRRATD